MADLAEPIAHLAGAIRTLNHGWAATSAVWHDSVQQDFEQQHLVVLDAQVAATLREMDRLARVITQARRHLR